MSRRSRSSDETPGYDSFLDIVANLVGILLIMVILVGGHAREQLVELATQALSLAEPAATPEDVAAAGAAADTLEKEIWELNATMKRVGAAATQRRAERDHVHVLVTALEHALAADREKLGAGERAEYDRRQALAQTRAELLQARRALSAVAHDAAPTTLSHLPTPIAQTVFQREEHFRLSNGRLTHIPFESLLAQLKADVPRKVYKLQKSSKATETIGPVGGFRLKYTLRRTEYNLETKLGAIPRQGIELEGFVLNPVREDLGEPLAAALATGSEFDTLLTGLDPRRATITVWVYPDSYAEHRQLKQTLYKKGFLMASRPLPEGFPIGGSPQGTRSSAQ